jgi:3-hydroxy acid dehydrogenase/malonic semialdehyde reductase
MWRAASRTCGSARSNVVSIDVLMSLDLSGKTAIVTGASSGIGAATARALADAGVRVAGGARRADRLETEIALELDVTDPGSCAHFVAAAVKQLGGLDILFNNAGLALGRAPIDESSEEDEERVFGTNVNGLVRMTRLCLPHFSDWGHIVNMGSVAGRQAYEGGATYIAAKFAERGFTYALREDLLGRPIRITTVDAGMVETEFSLVRFKGDAEKAAAVYKGVDPMQAGDIADCVMFALTRPWHVNVDEIVVKARNQASGARVLRDA